MLRKFLKNFLVLNLIIAFAVNINLSVFSHGCYENVNESLPKFYLDERTYKLKTKGQIISGPCGAFASIAALECYLKKNNMFEGYLSEKHLLTWMKRGEGNVGWHHNINDGMTFSQINSYFMSEEGPVLEKELPYNTEDTLFNESIHNIKPKYSVRGMQYLYSKEEIKKAVIKYGAVFTIIKIGERNSFHAVCIIGWDDSKNAWLVKDSGLPNGGCYCWMSYDKTCFDSTTFTNVKKYNEKEKVYQYDKFDINLERELNYKKEAVANVFDFDGNEFLDTVIVGANNECNNDYEIFFVPVKKTLEENKDRKNWVSLKKGTIEKYAGYIPIELDNKIKLNKQKGAIVFEIKPKKFTGDRGCHIYMQGIEEGLIRPIQKGTSYIGQKEDSNKYSFCDWNANADVIGQRNFSIKAITVKNK